MIDTDKPKFLAILNGLAAVKPGAKLTPDALDVWWFSMQGWTLDEFRAAAAKLALDCEFMPNPYHFAQLRKAAEPTAAEAWAQVLATVRTMSRYELVSLGPDIDRVVQQLGGYGSLSLMTTDQSQWVAKRFAERWAEQDHTAQARALLPERQAPRLVRGEG